MKTVKTVADLKQLALRSGAAVELGPQRFNTSNEKVRALPAKKAEPVAAEPPPPPPPPPAEPTKVEVDMEPVASAIERLQQLQAQLMQSITHQMAQLKPGEAPQEWEFTINRSTDGMLTSIRARAVK